MNAGYRRKIVFPVNNLNNIKVKIHTFSKNILGYLSIFIKYMF